MGGPKPKSVTQRIDELKPSQKLHIEIKDMQNNDTDWLSGMDEMDDAFPDPEETLNINNYPTLNDPNFSGKISLFKEFSDTKYNGNVGNIKELADKMCDAEFELMPHQLFQ